MSTIISLDEAQFPRLAAPTASRFLPLSDRRWPARVLVCANDSAATGDALMAARALAVRSRAEVSVLTVFEPRIPVPNVTGKRASARCERRDRCAAADLIRAIRADERRRFDGHVVWPVHLEIGNPVQTIIENARRSCADLVVVGLGSPDPLERQGGVAIPVCLSRYTEIPMLAAAPMLTALPQTVALLIDREIPDTTLIRTALRSIGDAAVLWVMIYAGVTARRGDGVKHDKDVLSRILGVVRREAAVVSKKILIRGVYRWGDPVDEILSFARDISADLIVVPVRGTAGTIRSLVPNVAAQLLLTATCSVLVVPTGDEEEGTTGGEPIHQRQRA